MRRLLAVGAAAALGALALWGCASSSAPVASNARAARDYEPDGGWANYRPVVNPYEPDPMESASGDPLSGPIVPSLPSSGAAPPTAR